MTVEEQNAVLKHVRALEAQLNQAREQLAVAYTRIEELTQQKSPPPKLVARLPWAGDHVVQFWEMDDFLLSAVGTFIGAGLREGDTGIVVATKPHREGLEQRLKADGLNVAVASLRGHYISIDAAAMLSQIMVDGQPSPEHFVKVVGSLITRAAKGRRHVRIFGEMVALLWTDGNRAAAVRLEELWNKLGEAHSFSLFCSYPMSSFNGHVYEEEFTQICHQHGQTLPAESFSQLSSPDERLRAITLLQQKASSLNVELAQRKKAEEQLWVSENRYRHLFDSILIGVFVADAAGIFLEANDAFLDLLGYSREDILAGTMQRNALAPQEFHAHNHHALQALQETGASGTYETEYLHKSGKYIPVLVAVTRIEYTETYVSFVLDISERKELEHRKDAFLITASHELRTPLTLVQGYLELLNVVPNLSSEQYQSFLSKACYACDELVLLLANIMDASRIEFDRRDLHCSHLLLKDVCGTLVTLFEPVLVLEQRPVVLDIADHVTAWADEMRLKQILRNLMANALRYSSQGTPLCIRATLEQENRMVRISVIDHGQGIPPDKQQAIFDKFVRLERDMQSIVRGSGLGLYITRQLVEAMQGTIRVTSSGVNGEGSCFSFTLLTSGWKAPHIHSGG